MLRNLSSRFSKTAAIVSALGVFSFASAANATCMGVSRTITLSPDDAFHVQGTESALGLRDKELILTFDDGPMPGTTSKILDALKEECVKATFFMVGRMAIAYPSMAKRVKREGHTIAHHTQSHNRLTSYSPAKGGHLIDRGISAVEKVVYGGSAETRTPFFRYPYLARSSKTDKLLRQRGLIAFGANIDSRDWELKSAYQVEQNILRQVRAQRKGIILMHDIKGRTAKMLPGLLDTLKREGYKIVHVKPGRSSAGGFISAGIRKNKPSSNDVEIKTASLAPEEKPKARKSASFEVAKPETVETPKRVKKTISMRGSIPAIGKKIKPNMRKYDVVWMTDAKGRPMLQLASK